MTAVLDRAGYPWRGVDKPESSELDEPEDGWSGAVICSGGDPIGAFLLCRHLRKREVPLAPVIVIVPHDQLGELELREDLFDDLCLNRSTPRSSAPDWPTCSGAPAGGCDPTCSNTDPWSSTWRPTRRR